MNKIKRYLGENHENTFKMDYGNDDPGSCNGDWHRFFYGD